MHLRVYTEEPNYSHDFNFFFQQKTAHLEVIDVGKGN